MNLTEFLKVFVPEQESRQPHLEARKTGVGVLFGNRRILAGELSDDAGVGHLDAVGMDPEWIVVVELLGELVQCRLHRVLRQRSGHVENLKIEVTVGDDRLGRDAVAARVQNDSARGGVGPYSGDEIAYAGEVFGDGVFDPGGLPASVALSDPMVPLESAESCNRTSASLTSAVMPLALWTRLPSVATEMLV